MTDKRIYLGDSTKEEALELREFLKCKGYKLYEDGSALTKYFGSWGNLYYSQNTHWVGSGSFGVSQEPHTVSLREFLRKYRRPKLNSIYD